MITVNAIYSYDCNCIRFSAHHPQWGKWDDSIPLLLKVRELPSYLKERMVVDVLHTFQSFNKDTGRDYTPFATADLRVRVLGPEAGYDIPSDVE